ncbi:helix-turn-helix domain-containing protein [Streptomyces sp. NPDC059698]|uniref:helix-turn-helix domain-containing protein n=1 Tax=unclassified Streptomyces TaxID=2593676 RepID=UPI00093C9700|nr:helix-turn-helix domain-containing protein [Streptomyces sp. CB02366]OKJ40351.1 TrmB family transcriptional regulator [Streptomyces sp. CB02366]WSS57846.1 LuxR C-terminal-related transcriptional regulator [Streptomyces sp. NBC_01178]
MLEIAGIGAAEERIYRLLVEVRNADVDEIVQRLHLRENEAALLLSSLHDKGLVERPPGDGGTRYVPVPPDVALQPLLARGQEALEGARRGVEQLTEEYRAAGRCHDAGQLVEVITGGGAIRRRLRRLAYGARSDLRWFCKADPVALRAQDNTEEFELLAQGIRYEAIYERACLEEPGMVDNVAQGIRAGETARATSTLPVRMVIIDSSVAVCPLMPGKASGARGEPTAAIIRSSTLLDALIALFDIQWAAGTPLHVTAEGGLADFAGGMGPGGSLADDERYLLSLVVAGVADKAIATQLGVSHRTVQRRITALMQRAGATTRTQLVWQAARRDWLS